VQRQVRELRAAGAERQLRRAGQRVVLGGDLEVPGEKPGRLEVAAAPARLQVVEVATPLQRLLPRRIEGQRAACAQFCQRAIRRLALRTVQLVEPERRAHRAFGVDRDAVLGKRSLHQRSELVELANAGVDLRDLELQG
jgi:hypothetical protein